MLPVHSGAHPMPAALPSYRIVELNPAGQDALYVRVAEDQPGVWHVHGRRSEAETAGAIARFGLSLARTHEEIGQPKVIHESWPNYGRQTEQALIRPSRLTRPIGWVCVRLIEVWS